MGIGSFKLDANFINKYWQIIFFLLCFSAQWGATSARLQSVEVDIVSLKKLEGIRTDVAVIQSDVDWVKESQKRTENQLQKLMEKL